MHLRSHEYYGALHAKRDDLTTIAVGRSVEALFKGYEQYQEMLKMLIKEIPIERRAIQNDLIETIDFNTKFNWAKPQGLSNPWNKIAETPFSKRFSASLSKGKSNSDIPSDRMRQR